MSIGAIDAPAPWIDGGRSRTSILPPASAGQGHRALQRILELAHVSGPRVRHQVPQRLLEMSAPPSSRPPNLRPCARPPRDRAPRPRRTSAENAARAAECRLCARAAAACGRESPRACRTGPRGTRLDTILARSLLVAAIMRTSTLRSRVAEPLHFPALDDAQQLHLQRRVMVPTSSRNSVPRWPPRSARRAWRPRR